MTKDAEWGPEELRRHAEALKERAQHLEEEQRQKEANLETNGEWCTRCKKPLARGCNGKGVSRAFNGSQEVWVMCPNEQERRKDEDLGPPGMPCPLGEECEECGGKGRVVTVPEDENEGGEPASESQSEVQR